MSCRVQVYDCYVKDKSGCMSFDACAWARKDGMHVSFALWEWIDYMYTVDDFTFCDMLLCPEAKTIYVTELVFYDHGDSYDQQYTYKNEVIKRECQPGYEDYYHNPEEKQKDIMDNLTEMILEIYPEYTSVRWFTQEDFDQTRYSVANALAKSVTCFSNHIPKDPISHIGKFMRPAWFDYELSTSKYIEDINPILDDLTKKIGFMENIMGSDVWERRGELFQRCKVVVT